MRAHIYEASIPSSMRRWSGVVPLLCSAEMACNTVSNTADMGYSIE